MWNIVFPKKLFYDLNSFLFDVAPKENASFLTANSSIIDSTRSSLLVTNILKPDSKSFNMTSEHSLELSSSYINDCIMSAEKSCQSLVFVHSHPNSRHPSTFSLIDEKTNARIFSNLSTILENKPLGSIVVSKKGLHGVIYNNCKVHNIYFFIMSGNIFYKTFGVNPGINNVREKITHIRQVPRFDRQIRAIGFDGHQQMTKMNIVIVGVGGIGSSVAVQLSRMGISNLTLIDMDLLDITNLSRVYGSNRNDIGKPKVEVIKKHIKNISDVNVRSIVQDITNSKDNKQSILELKKADVIFGCTDNLSSRSLLNDISLQYHIPLIDIGCRIIVTDNNSIRDIVAKVQTITTENACLWCTDTLDGRQILLEKLDDKERDKMIKEGYYQTIERQPSIIGLTTLAASLGVNKLLSLLGIYGEEYSSRTQIDLRNEFMINDSPMIKTNCVCITRRGLGDLRKIA